MNNDNQRESRPFRGEIVKKSNVLNEGIHLLDTAEKYKLFYLMIAQIAMQDKMPDSSVDIFNREYSFYLNDYADIKGIKDKYSFEEYVGKFLSDLKQKAAITIKDEYSITTIWVFDFVKFDYDKKGVKVRYRFSYSMSEHLFELKEKFMRYHIRNIMPMRSQYSIRLYELLKQYENIGERTFTVDELREMLGTRAYMIDSKTQKKQLLSDEYKDFADFKRYVIDKAVKEVNEYTDIEITGVHYKRIKRFVKYITFEFRKKSIPVISYRELRDDTKNQLPEYVETVWKNISEFRKQYQPFIKDIMEYIEKQKEKKVKVHSLSENQILFLLINFDKEMFTEDIVVTIIKKAITNKNLDNPMGFLIKALKIDMDKAILKELISTDEKVDGKVVPKTIEEKIAEGKPARRYFFTYFIELGEANDDYTLSFLEEIMNNSVYVEEDKTIYVVVPNNIYKVLFESEYLEGFKEHVALRYGIGNVVVYMKEKGK